MGVHGNTWQYMDKLQYVVMHSSTRQYKAIHGFTWQYMVIHGNTWLSHSNT